MSGTKQKRSHIALTYERLRKLVNYDPITGIFTRLEMAPGGRVSKDRLGWMTGKHASVGRGYRCFHLDGRQYRATHLAWFYMTGEFPSLCIDHRDLDTTNDAWNNLRLATNSQNVFNTRMSRRNRSGFRGVSRDDGGKWKAQIGYKNKRVYLGLFDTPEEAATAYKQKAVELFGDFVRAV